MTKQLTRRDLLAGAVGTVAASALSTPAKAISDPPVRVGGPRLRIGCCAYSYRDFLTGKKQPAMTMDDFIDRMAEIGVDGVELTSYYWPNPITHAYIKKIVRRCFLLGIDICATAINNTFAIPPVPDREKELATVRKWIDYAVDMGAPCLRVFAGTQPRGETEEQGRKWTIDSFNIACEYAAEKGVMLALENHGGVVATPEAILEVMHGVNSDWFGLKLDTGNFHTHDPYADTAKCAPYAITTHIKTEIYPDNKRQPTDMSRVVKILNDAGYRGYMNLEYEAAEDPLVAVPRTLKELMKLV